MATKKKLFPAIQTICQTILLKLWETKKNLTKNKLIEAHNKMEAMIKKNIFKKTWTIWKQMI
jgi:hypothetical protein